MKRKWSIFHQKRLRGIKLKISSWFHNAFPGKYCWADCVAWSINPYRLNPFKIDNAKGCEQESKDHPHNLCYCGGWQNGVCWDLMSKEQRDKIIKERESVPVSDEIPF